MSIMIEPKNPIGRDVTIGAVTGLTSGLFGVGGGIILVPILTILFAVNQRTAQATSLVVVALAAVTGATTYSLAGSVSWAAVPFLIAGGLVGTLLGTAAVKKIRDQILKLAFGLFLIIVAIRIIIQSFDPAALTAPSLGLGLWPVFLLVGFAMGLLSALLGVGGGIIVIPILITLFGFTPQLAAGTSLVVMIPIVLLGALRLTKVGFTNWAQGVQIGIPAALAAVGGAALALATQPAIVQIAFAILLVLAGAQMMWRAR
jgi:uncharacterized membrane protein YfcA